mmetsp:Transcript_28843/g.81363  ORF Transcript_28843/g.81363 Transcript_28843/m.81363 type:complete len:278 (+) Transcript_28843:332-1165(+)
MLASISSMPAASASIWEAAEASFVWTETSAPFSVGAASVSAGTLASVPSTADASAAAWDAPAGSPWDAADFFWLSSSASLSSGSASASGGMPASISSKPAVRAASWDAADVSDWMATSAPLSVGAASASGGMVASIPSLPDPNASAPAPPPGATAAATGAGASMQGAIISLKRSLHLEHFGEGPLVKASRHGTMHSAFQNLCALSEQSWQGSVIPTAVRTHDCRSSRRLPMHCWHPTLVRCTNSSPWMPHGLLHHLKRSMRSIAQHAATGSVNPQAW